MKFFLVLCLLAFISCDFIDTVKCIVSQPKIVEFGLKIFSYITTKDYDKILPAVLASITDIIAAVKECI